MLSNILLGLNIDHVGTLRNVRGAAYPDPVYAAYVAENAGIDSITIHLREDRRHITDRDIMLLRKTIQVNMNLEIAATDEMVNIACTLKPNYCCLVPERRQEMTTECGLDVVHQTCKLKDLIFKLINAGIRVSLFIDPDEQQISASYDVGVSYIELHTGAYALSMDEKNRAIEYHRIQKSAQYAVSLGLKVNAGHGLNYHNVQPIAMLPYIQELNIGHSIISRAIFSGLYQAIVDMKELLKRSREGGI